MKAALRPVAAECGLVLHNHTTTLSDIPVGERVAFVLRDPVERFVSGFNSRLRMGRPLRNSKWSDGEAQAFALFKTPNDLAEALKPPVCEAALRAMHEIAHVKTRLTETLGSKDQVLERLDDILWIGRTENLESDFERLRERMRLPPDLALPSDPINAHKTPDGFSTDLSEHGRRCVADWYTDDIEFLTWLEHCVRPIVESPRAINFAGVTTRVPDVPPWHTLREEAL